MNKLDNVLEFQKILNDVQKMVHISIADQDFEDLKEANYSLCFAKKVGDNDYNVVWQSSDKFLLHNDFSWTPQYALFGTNTFKENIVVTASTNTVPIKLQEKAKLNKFGKLENPKTGGEPTGFTMENEYGSIHPGVNQLSTIAGKTISTPIYVATSPIVKGECLLEPVEKVLVWFQQKVQTSMMFSSARSYSVEIDLTKTNVESWKFVNGVWEKE